MRRRAEGTPVAYLVGHREFYSLDFRVTPDVLIPRPETEFLVLALLDRIKARAAGDGRFAWPTSAPAAASSPSRVARHAPQARVTAIDISPAALAVARDNAAAAGRGRARSSSSKATCSRPLPAERRFDFIVSNPPYVSTAEMAELPRDVREPTSRELALAAGADGHRA